jgi:2Fe-2S ferredoxin
MGGVNPYIAKADAPRAGKKFLVTFVDEESGERKAFEVDPAKIPYGRTGLDGSLLDIALAGAGMEIDHACGGVCACATCHVHVVEGLESCGEATDDELDQLDSARDLKLESRLSCQCVPNGTMNLVVVIPAWNKNLAREGH